MQVGNRKLKIGLIGCGFMGSHYHSVFSAYGCDVTACCDPTPSKLSLFADERNIGLRFTDYRELIASAGVDAIINATPDLLHLPVILKAFEAGLPVMTEKPFVASLAECHALSRVPHPPPLLVNFSKRNAPAYAAAAELVQSGRMGEVLHFSAGYDQDWVFSKAFGDWEQESSWAWRLDRSHAPAGAVGDLGSHVFDLVENIIGRVKSVGASVLRPGGGPIGSLPLIHDSIDFFQASLELDNGVPGRIRAGRIVSGERDRIWLEVYGSRGALKMDLEADRDHVQFYDNEDSRGKWVSLAGKKPVSTYRRFLSIISATPGEAPSGLADGLRNQCCIEAVLRSAEDGGKERSV
jgi:predicted dehydrogenase